MAKKIWTICLSVLMTGFYYAKNVNAIETTREMLVKPPLIQMAILLDTSGSMSGLIDQAKTQLWAIVNEFATTTKYKNIPELQLALYEYGKSSIPAEQGYIRLIVPFTTDLDKVSEELFALKTNGGNEYCGMVINSAIEALTWSNSSDDFKVIFIAGNEPFTQGKVDYRKACKAAIEKGIVVNTIHCGSYDQGVSGHWKDGAVLADGKYLNIDHNRKAVHIEAPQDKEITRLGGELNKTYIAFGLAGKAGKERQTQQDSNAYSAAPGAMMKRAISKSSAYYRNSAWDLVDAVKEKTVKLEELKDEDLPKEMQQMSDQKKQEYLETKAQERKNIQQQINELNKLRKKYVAQEMTKRLDKGADTLEKVIIKTIREQVTDKNFTFDSVEESSK